MIREFKKYGAPLVMERFSANNRDQEGSVSSSRKCIFKLGSTVLLILFQFQRRKGNHHIKRYGEPLKLDFHTGLTPKSSAHSSLSLPSAVSSPQSEAPGR